MRRAIVLKENSWKRRLPQKVEPLRLSSLRDKKQTYLRVGDKVFHKKFKSWGYGVVVETKTSDVPGGFCFVRILFQDGKGRVFDNSFTSTTCCYYSGITLLNRIEL